MIHFEIIFMISDAYYFKNLIYMTDLENSKYFIAVHLLHFHLNLLQKLQYFNMPESQCK